MFGGCLEQVIQSILGGFSLLLSRAGGLPSMPAMLRHANDLKQRLI